MLSEAGLTGTRETEILEYPLIRYFLRHTRPGRQIMKARLARTNSRDLGTPPEALSLLYNFTHPTPDPEGKIRKTYDEYVSRISGADKVISLELARLLWNLLNRDHPRLIVDLGSGFSSYIFRLYQQQCRQYGMECQVYSCDDNHYWLDRTILFLEEKGLSTEGVMPWKNFIRKHADLRPGLILHDLGHMPVRIETLPQVIDLCNTQTVLIVDDVHKSEMRKAVLAQLRQRPLKGYDLSGYTYDSFGRFAWMLKSELNV